MKYEGMLKKANKNVLNHSEKQSATYPNSKPPDAAKMQVRTTWRVNPPVYRAEFAPAGPWAIAPTAIA